MQLQLCDSSLDVAQFVQNLASSHLLTKCDCQIAVVQVNFDWPNGSAGQAKDHNANSSKAGQLVGSKAQAVKNILNALPPKVKMLICNYTTEVGYESTPWQDDCLGSKKWLPGFAFLVFHFFTWGFNSC